MVEHPPSQPSYLKNGPFRDPTSGSMHSHDALTGMEPTPTCRTCGTPVDLTRRNAVDSVIYRHVMCRGCGVICILEGPVRNVVDGPTQTSIDPVVASVR